MTLSTRILAVAAWGALALAQTSDVREITLPQVRADTFTVTVDISDSCEDFNNINCTYNVLGAGVQTVSYFESDGDAIIWGDVNIGSVANLLLQQTFQSARNQTRHKRALTVLPARPWPNALVRYQYMDQNSDTLLRSLIDDAIANWQQVAPFLDFKEERNGAGPIYSASTAGILSISTNIEPLGLCQTTLGYYSGMGMTLTLTPLSSALALGLQGYCPLSAAVHEIGHTLSFLHEQQRSDAFKPSPGGGIKYNCANVIGGCAGATATTNFNPQTGDESGPYDLLSIMQYPNTAFGADDGTGGMLVTLDGAPTVSEVQSRDFPSALDARQLCEVLYPTFCAATGYCGDRVVQGAEECDPPGVGGCSPGCRLTCGNGKIDDGEECDDGNRTDNDGCSSTCKIEKCGDGILQRNEECDDGNTNDNDGCSSTCVKESCGDGIIQTGEECDDNNTLDNDGCSSRCFLEICGDGIIQIGEQCDDGNTVDGDGCSSTCKIERCGDGIIQGREECDDGNTVDDDGCSAACQIEKCGDGIIQGSEQCDDGNLLDGDGCSSKCVIENCGDGIVQPYEECDDGNTVNGDGCSARCKIEKCGDGILQRSLGEECDDGNLKDGDGCSSKCKREHAPPEGCCGDGIVQPGFGEECDDGNLNDGDGCSSSCYLEEKNPCDKCTHRKMCGDGIIQFELGEECDDGNVLGGDGCSANCKKETTCPACKDHKDPHYPNDTHYPQTEYPNGCPDSGDCEDFIDYHGSQTKGSPDYEDSHYDNTNFCDDCEDSHDSNTNYPSDSEDSYDSNTKPPPDYQNAPDANPKNPYKPEDSNNPQDSYRPGSAPVDSGRKPQDATKGQTISYPDGNKPEQGTGASTTRPLQYTGSGSTISLVSSVERLINALVVAFLIFN